MFNQTFKVYCLLPLSEMKPGSVETVEAIPEKVISVSVIFTVAEIGVPPTYNNALPAPDPSISVHFVIVLLPPALNLMLENLKGALSSPGETPSS